jgi:glycosyltransferase involved in cell wall biosynthesis
VRVLIDTTFSRRAPFSGTAVYLDRLQRALADIGAIDVVTVANEHRRPPAGGGLGSVRNLAADWWWTAVKLPRLAKQSQADVVHHPLPARARTPLPQVITVHDLSFERLPRHFNTAFRLHAHLSHRAAARAANGVICVSETTAGDVRSLWGIPDGRIAIARHGPGQEPPPGRGRRAHFLYVGDDEPRKNLGALLAAYSRYRQAVPEALPLVLAGSTAAAEPGVVLEEKPSAARLSELYADAVALVHLSLYEGFGLTPLEAMHAGTPVLAAAAPGVTEVCADAARYVDPGDPVGIALTMAELAGSPALQAELGERGKRRAALFSWSASARAHLDAYSLAQTGP